MVPNYPRVISRRSGPGTATGSGDVLVDNKGCEWNVISEAEASILRSGTAVYPIRTLYPDGTIR